MADSPIACSPPLGPLDDRARAARVQAELSPFTPSRKIHLDKIAWLDRGIGQLVARFPRDCTRLDMASLCDNMLQRVLRDSEKQIVYQIAGVKSRLPWLACPSTRCRESSRPKRPARDLSLLAYVVQSTLGQPHAVA